MKDRPRRFGVAALDEYRKLVTSFLSRDRGERFETFVNSTNEHAQVVIEEFVKFAKKEILIAANEASADQFDTPGVLKRLADFVMRGGRLRVIVEGEIHTSGFVRAMLNEKRATVHNLTVADKPMFGFFVVDGKLWRRGPDAEVRRPIMGNDEKFARELVRLFHRMDERSIPMSHLDSAVSDSEIAEMLSRSDRARVSASVRILSATKPLIKSLQEDPSRLIGLTPEEFELLICDRLEAMGLKVQKVGHAYRRDGGVDIIAFDRARPFSGLLAVQTKHSTVKKSVSARAVKDMRAVLQAAPFDAGVVVTNTSFTPDARWWAENRGQIIRLRDIDDVRRWILGKFVADRELTGFPDKIKLGEVVIPIPKEWRQN